MIEWMPHYDQAPGYSLMLSFTTWTPGFLWYATLIFLLFLRPTKPQGLCTCSSSSPTPLCASLSPFLQVSAQMPFLGEALLVHSSVLILPILLYFLPEHTLLSVIKISFNFLTLGFSMLIDSYIPNVFAVPTSQRLVNIHWITERKVSLFNHISQESGCMLCSILS